MLSKEALEVVLEESETMVVEWADTRDGPGYRVIENALDEFFKEKEITGTEKETMVQNVRAFLLMDMAIVGW